MYCRNWEYQLEWAVPAGSRRETQKKISQRRQVSRMIQSKAVLNCGSKTIRRISTMPIFEYKCQKCGKKFEIFRSLSSHEPVSCPNCDSKETTKLFSTFASVGGGDQSGSSCSAGSSCGAGGFTWGVWVSRRLAQKKWIIRLFIDFILHFLQIQVKLFHKFEGWVGSHSKSRNDAYPKKVGWVDQ